MNEDAHVSSMKKKTDFEKGSLARKLKDHGIEGRFHPQKEGG
ncbi:MAG TPA: hypothetical protein VF372_05090 [Thermodesulfobacteriota bacterium]